MTQVSVVQPELEVEQEVVLIKASRIRRYEDQPRTYFSEESIRALADAIKKDGQRTPVEVVRIMNEKGGDQPFVLIDGERRWRSCQLIDVDYPMRTIVKVVKDAREHFKLSAIANLHREDMTITDKARSIRRLQQDYNMTLEELATTHGMSVSSISQYLSLFKLDPRVFDMMDPAKIPEGEEVLGFSVSIELARLPDHELQFKLAGEILDAELGINDARLLISERAERRGYGFGGRQKHASDNYANLKRALGRMQKQLGRYLIARQGDAVIQAFLTRSRDERERDENEIDEMIRQLQKLKLAIQGKTTQS